MGSNSITTPIIRIILRSGTRTIRFTPIATTRQSASEIWTFTIVFQMRSAIITRTVVIATAEFVRLAYRPMPSIC